MFKRAVLALALGVAAHAQILEVKQLFNKKIVKVQRETRSVKRHYYAQTAIDESRIYDVTLRFSGFVEKLYADQTLMPLKKGEKLFRIYSKEIANIKEERELARANGQRRIVRSLDKKLQLLGVDSAVASDYTVEMIAPSNGVVLEKHIQQGTFVKRGALLYRIADLSKIWVVASIYQKDIPFVHTGMHASVAIEGVGRFSGKVDYLYPMADPKKRTADIRIVLENPEGKIYPNLFARVEIESAKRTIYTLPKSAVLRKGAKFFIFKPLEEGAFEPVEVKARLIDSRTYEILEGVTAGEKVIDRALFLLDADAITNGLYESDEDEEW